MSLSDIFSLHIKTSRNRRTAPKAVHILNSADMSLGSVKPLIILAAMLVASTEALMKPLPPYVGMPTQDGLTRLFFSSRVTRRDPMISMSCFAGYIGESNLIAEQYSGAYSACLKDAQRSRRGIDIDFLPARRSIELSAESVCRALTKCNKVNGTLDSFNCHAAAVSRNDSICHE